MNITERIKQELKRKPNSTTTNISFKIEQLKKVCKKLKLNPNHTDSVTLREKMLETIMNQEKL